MIKFRCSRLGEVMTDPRAKKDKLSQTTEKYIREIYLADKYGRKKDFSSKEMKKGIECEEDSITLLNSVLSTFFGKNEQYFENEYITGTPDILFSDSVIDIKTSWDLFTFTEAGMTPAYMWQLMGYMWLTGKRMGYLAYCLVDTPESFIMDELRRNSWSMGYISDTTPEYQEMEEQVRRNMTFSDIEENLRVKLFRVDFDQVRVDALKERIKDCREYYESLSSRPSLNINFDLSCEIDEDVAAEALIVSSTHGVPMEQLFDSGMCPAPTQFARHQHRALAVSRGVGVRQLAIKIGINHASVINSVTVHESLLKSDKTYQKLWKDVKRKHDEWLSGKTA